jgi:hypothetical protein
VFDSVKLQKAESRSLSSAGQKPDLVTLAARRVYQRIKYAKRAMKKKKRRKEKRKQSDPRETE